VTGEIAEIDFADMPAITMRMARIASTSSDWRRRRPTSR